MEGNEDFSFERRKRSHHQECEEMGTTGDIILDTKGSCFLCLQKISNGGEVDEIFSFRNICRYLNIDQQLIFEKCVKEHFSSVNVMNTVKKKNRVNFGVILCARCSAVSRNISELICEMEMLEMTMLHQLQEIHKVLSGPLNQDLVLERWNKLKLAMASGSSNTMDVTLMEHLRREARRKSEMKLQHLKATSLPRVALERLTISSEMEETTTDGDGQLVEHEMRVEIYQPDIRIDEEPPSFHSSIDLRSPSPALIEIETLKNDDPSSLAIAGVVTASKPINNDRQLVLLQGHSEISQISMNFPIGMSEIIWICEAPAGGCGQKFKFESGFWAHKKYNCPKRKARKRPKLQRERYSLKKGSFLNKSKRQEKAPQLLPASPWNIKKRPNSLPMKLFPEIFKNYCVKVGIKSGLYRCLLCDSGRKPGHQSVILRHILIIHPEVFFPNNKKRNPNMSEKSFKEHCLAVIGEKSNYKLISSPETRRKPGLCAFCGVRVPNYYYGLQYHLVMEHHKILELKLEARTRFDLDGNQSKEMEETLALEPLQNGSETEEITNSSQAQDILQPETMSPAKDKTEVQVQPLSLRGLLSPSNFYDEMVETDWSVNFEKDTQTVSDGLDTETVLEAVQAYHPEAMESGPSPSLTISKKMHGKIPSSKSRPTNPARSKTTQLSPSPGAHFQNILKKNCKKVSKKHKILYKCSACKPIAKPKPHSISMSLKHLAIYHPEVFFLDQKISNISQKSFKFHCRAVLEEKSNYIPISSSSKRRKILCSHCPVKIPGSYSNLKYHLILIHYEILKARLVSRLKKFVELKMQKAVGLLVKFEPKEDRESGESLRGIDCDGDHINKETENTSTSGSNGGESCTEEIMENGREMEEDDKMEEPETTPDIFKESPPETTPNNYMKDIPPETTPDNLEEIPPGNITESQLDTGTTTDQREDMNKCKYFDVNLFKNHWISMLSPDQKRFKCLHCSLVFIERETQGSLDFPYSISVHLVKAHSEKVFISAKLDKLSETEFKICYNHAMTRVTKIGRQNYAIESKELNFKGYCCHFLLCKLCKQISTNEFAFQFHFAVVHWNLFEIFVRHVQKKMIEKGRNSIETSQPSTSGSGGASSSGINDRLQESFVDNFANHCKYFVPGQRYECLYCDHVNKSGENHFCDHLLDKHSEKIFASLKLVELSEGVFKQCCLEVLMSEETKANQFRDRNKVICRLCGLRFLNGVIFRHHFVLKHYDSFQEKLMHLQRNIVYAPVPRSRCVVGHQGQRQDQDWSVGQGQGGRHLTRQEEVIEAGPVVSVIPVVECPEVVVVMEENNDRLESD